MDTNKTFSEAVDTYLSQADYLTDDDLPAIIALKEAARELDTTGVQAALLNTFGVTLRSLQKRKQNDTGIADEAEAFLMDL